MILDRLEPHLCRQRRQPGGPGTGKTTMNEDIKVMFAFCNIPNLSYQNIHVYGRKQNATEIAKLIGGCKPSSSQGHLRPSQGNKTARDLPNSLCLIRPELIQRFLIKEYERQKVKLCRNWTLNRKKNTPYSNLPPSSDWWRVTAQGWLRPVYQLPCRPIRALPVWSRGVPSVTATLLPPRAQTTELAAQFCLKPHTCKENLSSSSSPSRFTKLISPITTFRLQHVLPIILHTRP